MDVQGYISKRDTVGLRKLLSKDKKKKWLKQRYMNDQGALHLACDYGDPEIVSMLLKYNGDPNETDVSAQTSLHIACKQASLEVITLLISKNANVTAKSFQGNTPMHFLIGHKPTIENITDFYGVLELLKENGADLNARNGQGETPLSLACLKRSEKNAMWLIRQGADVNISNKKGERALHHAVRFGSEGLISILISAGAYVTGNNLGVESPIELANRAGRKSIAAILTDHAYLKATSQTITINGTEVTDEYLCHLKKLCITHVMEYSQPKLSPRRPSAVRRKKSNVGDCFRKYQMLVDILEMNALLFEPPEKMVWEGEIFVGNEDSDEWSQKYAVVDDDKLDISKDGEKFRQIDLSQNIRFEVYSSDISRVTIVYCLSTGDKKEHYRSKDFDFKLLKTLINNSKRPVEYIDDEPVLQTIQNLEKLNIISDGKASDSLFVPKVVRKISFGAKEFVGSPVVIPQLRNSLSKSETIAPMIEVNNSVGTVSPSGAIISTNFSSFFYAEIFSPDLVMQHQKEYDTAHSYLFTSGSFSDLLNYCILHAHPSLFAGNTDVEAFYLCYYHHCELQDVIDGINNTWNNHIAVPWPKPYSNVEPASRLFAFLKGFIKSPFVLPDEEKELQFRSDLAELYGNLIANPGKPYETVSKLRDAVQKIKTAREQSSINQLCDLNSLLGGKAESSDKILLNLESDTIASQIVLINADLYKQLQLADLLDLRYQTDKKFATSLNKVHAFSNKIYLLVPTTILQSDDIEVQKVTLKKWIVIAEKLFALKDYNSTIQVINGISETSITRLDYLKRCLSAKWIERFEKVRSCFDGEGNYAKYRMLSTEAPAIPFVGVTLKDLVFTYEGNPDRIGNGINFQKYRHILQIIKTLKITNTKQYDYSFLKFDPQVARELLTVTPMTQDQLYDRSVQCSAAYTEKISSAAPGKSPHRIQRKPSLEKRPNRNLTPVMPSPEAESPTTNTVRSKRLDKYTKSSGSFASQEQKAVPTQELHLEKTSHHSLHHSPLQRTKDSYRLSRTRRQEKKSNKANLYLRSSGPELTTPTISIPAYKKSRTATNIYEDSEISQPGENEEQKIKVVVHTQKKKKFRFF